MAEAVGGILLKGVVENGGPPLVAFIKRQMPAKQTEKWDKRVSEISLVLLGATPPSDDAPPDPDLTEFLASLAIYKENRALMAELNAAKANGAWNYLDRRKLSAKLADLGKNVYIVGVTTSTLIATKRLCRKAGHPQPCSLCSPQAAISASNAVDYIDEETEDAELYRIPTQPNPW
ncbi:hypothetical protein MVEN_00833500 [Mycena venus]|uniref:Uncharacterized protein n=1 Tax=Mycena venus TaxID=2733690 RepID=A0A8H6YBA2_9AGAR|nr:hypothetical protein MVEN_00833500 [Mycena venus]